ncbi:MAG: fumarate hydratase [Betaproteobacteria bacterium]|nr:fumarate hydratase [Betaproteobacteria bacterium]
MKIDLLALEDAAKMLYIRALKVLPPDIKDGLGRLHQAETGATAKSVLGTMVRNIAVAEETDNLLCQDTGIPIYNITIGRGVQVDGFELHQAIRRGCERATREHPLRSSVVHPLTRRNEHTSCGIGAGGKTCPPTIVGVGLGGTSDLVVALAKRAATRALGSRCADPDGAALEAELSQAVNRLGVGPQGLGGDATAFAVQVELAATHITMNPIAVNMQCHSARRARATFTPAGLSYGF